MNTNTVADKNADFNEFKFDKMKLELFVSESQKIGNKANYLDLWMNFCGLFDPAVRIFNLSGKSEMPNRESHCQKGFIGVIFHRNQKKIIDCYKDGVTKRIAIDIEDLVNDHSNETALQAVREVRNPEVPGIGKTDALLDFILGCFVLTKTRISSERWLNIIKGIYDLQPYSNQHRDGASLINTDQFSIDELGLTIIAKRSEKNFTFVLSDKLDKSLGAILMVSELKEYRFS